MKKRIISFLLTMMILSSCSAQSGSDTQGSDSAVPETEPIVTEQTVTGTASLTWHINTQFVAAVDVTVEGDVIKSIAIRDGSAVMTDAFDGWLDGRDAYLAQYEGKTIEQIKALTANPPEDVTDHHDGGSMSGDIDAVSGATASSTVVAMAVKNAVEKLED